LGTQVHWPEDWPRERSLKLLGTTGTSFGLYDPAGFEAYFVELAEAADPGRRHELAAKYWVT